MILVWLAAAFALYYPALNGEWLFDDPAIPQDMLPLWAKNSGYRPKLRRMGTRDFTHLTYLWTWLLFGESRAAFHAGNLVLHAATTELLYLIAYPSGREIALVAAGLFLVHPLQVSAVAYVSGRAAMLATFWTFLGMWAFQHGGYWLTVPLLTQYLAWKSKEDGSLYSIFYVMLWFLPRPI